MQVFAEKGDRLTRPGETPPQPRENGRPQAALAVLPPPEGAPTTEWVSCALCSSDDPVPIATKRGFRLVRCGSCELVYVNPRPRGHDLIAPYLTAGYVERHRLAADDPGRTALARRRLGFLARHAAGGRLLDVGCSTGWFLAEATAAGYQGVGLDVSPMAVEFARERGLDARLATLESFTQASTGPGADDGRFDVVTMLDSLEHMPRPLAALEAAARALRDGGLLLVTTPAEDGWFPRLTYALLGRTLGIWDHPTPPAHAYQFSRTTLQGLLARAGFAIVDAKTEAIPLSHSAAELEAAVIDGAKRVLARRSSRTSERAGGGTSTAALHERITARLRPTEEDARPAGRAGRPRSQRLGRATARAVVRVGCWALAAAVSPPAAWLGRGDNLVVLARKQAPVREVP
jgi:2-polyprenyl-3-methyl-5-hydroxy-6-metoxy-1,4-benzoquinol methylase